MKHLSKLFFAASIFCATAQADIIYNQNVSPDVIFGSGNANGGFAVDSQNGVELGLRAKLRFDENNKPANRFNNNGIGQYYFDNIAPPSGFNWEEEGSPNTAIWNFEFSVNSNVDGSGTVLSGLTYLINIDFDPSLETQFYSFDPINVPTADHSIGTNETGNGEGTKIDRFSATAEQDYNALIDSKNVAQNSWNMEFFNSNIFSFTNTDDGVYDISLTAFENGIELASTSIQVVAGDGAISVPAPATALLFLSGGLLLLRRK